MKLVELLTLSAVLLLAPMAASAGLIGSLLDPILNDSGPAPAVPEPSGALVMGVALGTVALATRRNRK